MKEIMIELLDKYFVIIPLIATILIYIILPLVLICLIIKWIKKK